MFEKVQEAIVCQDPDPVQCFLSDRAADEVDSAIDEQGEPKTCSILAVDASIRDILEEGAATTVAVAFNAVIHVGADDAPREVDTVWRFYRAHAQDNWRLDSLNA